MVLKPNFLHLFVCFRVFFLWLNFLFLIALEQFYLELFGRTTTPFYYLLLSIRNTRRSWNIIFDTYLFVLELYFWMLQRNFIWSCLSILPPLPASVSDCPTRDGQKKMNHKVIFRIVQIYIFFAILKLEIVFKLIQHIFIFLMVHRMPNALTKLPHHSELFSPTVGTLVPRVSKPTFLSNI